MPKRKKKKESQKATQITNYNRLTNYNRYTQTEQLEIENDGISSLRINKELFKDIVYRYSTMRQKCNNMEFNYFHLKQDYYELQQTHYSLQKAYFLMYNNGKRNNSKNEDKDVATKEFLASIMNSYLNNIKERNHAIEERNSSIVDLNNIILERNNVIIECNNIKNDYVKLQESYNNLQKIYAALKKNFDDQTKKLERVTNSYKVTTSYIDNIITKEKNKASSLDEDVISSSEFKPAINSGELDEASISSLKLREGVLSDKSVLLFKNNANHSFNKYPTDHHNSRLVNTRSKVQLVNLINYQNRKICYENFINSTNSSVKTSATEKQQYSNEMHQGKKQQSKKKNPKYN